MQPKSALHFAFFLATTFSFVVFTAAQSKPPAHPKDSDLVTRIQRVENGIPPIPLSGTEPQLQLNLEKLMQLYKVPGLSVAVMDNFKVAWAKGYGVTEAAPVVEALW